MVLAVTLDTRKHDRTSHVQSLLPRASRPTRIGGYLVETRGDRFACREIVRLKESSGSRAEPFSCELEDPRVLGHVDGEVRPKLSILDQACERLHAVARVLDFPPGFGSVAGST